MRLVFKMVLYSIVLNFAVGIMMTAIPVFDTNPEYRGGLFYDSGYVDEFNSSMSGSIDPTGDLEDTSDAFDRLLDKLHLGIIAKFLNAVDMYMFGFLKVIERVFGGVMDSALESVVFLGLRGMITIGYILGAILLWTGKNVTK